MAWQESSGVTSEWSRSGQLEGTHAGWNVAGNIVIQVCHLVRGERVVP